jgi:hypothetical protein
MLDLSLRATDVKTTISDKVKNKFVKLIKKCTKMNCCASSPCHPCAQIHQVIVLNTLVEITSRLSSQMGVMNHCTTSFEPLARVVSLKLSGFFE